MLGLYIIGEIELGDVDLLVPVEVRHEVLIVVAAIADAREEVRMVVERLLEGE